MSPRKDEPIASSLHLHRTPRTVRTIFGLWLPLAVSFELMMLEGPAFQGAIGRLADPALNLAAWGLTMSLSLLIESPVIMLLSTSIALSKDLPSFLALRRFTVLLCAACTVMTAAVAYTPMFDLIAARIMGQPQPIVDAARPAMRIMLLWTAAIGWRRFYQGLLVRHGRTRLVSYGAAIRLTVAIGTVIALVGLGALPGVQVAAIAVTAAVVAEAIATTIFAGPVLATLVPRRSESDDEAPSQLAIWRFHTPLAATTLLTLLAQPMTAAALARMADPVSTLAAWPVAFMVLLVVRGGGLAYQETTVAEARHADAGPALRRLAWLLGWAGVLCAAGSAATPLLAWYLCSIVHVPAGLHSLVTTGVLVGAGVPLLTALGSWARGLLMSRGQTSLVYRGMVWSLAALAAALVAGVALRLPPMWVAAGAMTFAAAAEFGYLTRAIGR